MHACMYIHIYIYIYIMYVCVFINVRPQACDMRIRSPVLQDSEQGPGADQRGKCEKTRRSDCQSTWSQFRSRGLTLAKAHVMPKGRAKSTVALSHRETSKVGGFLVFKRNLQQGHRLKTNKQTKNEDKAMCSEKGLGPFSQDAVSDPTRDVKATASMYANIDAATNVHNIDFKASRNLRMRILQKCLQNLADTKSSCLWHRPLELHPRSPCVILKSPMTSFSPRMARATRRERKTPWIRSTGASLLQPAWEGFRKRNQAQKPAKSGALGSPCFGLRSFPLLPLKDSNKVKKASIPMSENFKSVSPLARQKNHPISVDGLDPAKRALCLWLSLSTRPNAGLKNRKSHDRSIFGWVRAEAAHRNPLPSDLATLTTSE